MDDRTLVFAHKIATASILLVGASLNVAGLMAGMMAVGEVVFTTFGESILTLWFLAAFTLGVMVQRRVPAIPGWANILRLVITVYMGMLVVVHGINNLALGRGAAYAELFSGQTYMICAIIVMLCLALFISTYKTQQQESASQLTNG